MTTNTTSGNIFLETAEKYIQKNISVFPIPQPGITDDNNNPYDGKRPSRPWSEYKNSLPTPELIQKWFSQPSNNKNNIAITTGDISCLIVLDIDGDRSKRIFESQLLLKFSESLRVKTLNTTHVQTGGGGAHIWFKYRPEDFPEGIATKPYLRFKDHDEICLKASGSYVIAPPSIHSSGRRYEFEGELSYLETLTKAEALELLTLLEGLKSKNYTTSITTSVMVAHTTTIPPSTTIELQPVSVTGVANTVKPAYIKTNRDEIVFSLSGYLHKSFISENSLLQIIQQLAAGDEERALRLRVAGETCKKPGDSDKVSGYQRLLEALVLSLGADSENNAKEIISEIDRIIKEAADQQGFVFPATEITSEKTTATTRTVIDELMQKYTFKTLKDTKEIYYYDNDHGIFVNEGEILIESELERMKPDISTHLVNEVINHIRRRTYIDRSAFDSQPEWLVFKNCTVNLKTLETKAHGPEFMATVRIPVLYQQEQSVLGDFFEWVGEKESCPCPTIMKFMYEIMASEDVEIVLDFIAYCLWRSFPFHSYLLLNGPGRNGKGTLLTLIQRFLGTENVSAESLHRLLDNNFATAQLYRKLANIDADLNTEALKDSGTLKKLTGGDLIPAERKYLPTFYFVNYSKQIFSANTIPKTPDETDAFFARQIIINFPNQFFGDNIDYYIIDKLTTPEELSGLLKVVLRRLPRVLKEGIKRTTADSIADNYQKYITSSDPVRAFYENRLYIDAGVTTPKDQLYLAYQEFCKENSLSPESEQSFSRTLTK
ncbi:MAG TPA: phage/plasmid primase, P4 family [Nitrososphaeraceae archaeon]